MGMVVLGLPGWAGWDCGLCFWDLTWLGVDCVSWTCWAFQLGSCCGINIGLSSLGWDVFRIGGGFAGRVRGCAGYWISCAFSLGVVTVVFLGGWGVGLDELVILLSLNWF